MKKLTQAEEKKVESLRKIFPQTIKVRITSCEEGGFSARVLEPESLKCVITQGENLLELTEMINDAIYLVLDIPEKYYPYMVTYLAPQCLYEHFGFLPSIKTKNVLKFSISSSVC